MPNPKQCPPPGRKAKKEDDFEEVLGVMALDPKTTYDMQLHFALAHMRRADGDLPPLNNGRKALDFLAGRGQPRCDM